MRKRRRGLTASVAAALALVMASCGGGGDDGAGAANTAANPAANNVVIKLIAFKPEQVQVAAGTAVTWRNDDATEHTVTSGSVRQDGGTVQATPDGMFDSGMLAGGKTFTFAAAKPGTYSYYCRIHPATMRGEIVVT